MEEITIEEKGCAKINLALHVTGVKEDGYHILDSIVVFTDIFDILLFKKGKKNLLTFTGEFSKALNVKKNSVIEALKLFENLLADHFAINVEKNFKSVSPNVNRGDFVFFTGPQLHKSDDQFNSIPRVSFVIRYLSNLKDTKYHPLP